VQRILSPRRLPFRHPGEKEAAGGFEPPYKGFADPRLNLLATPPLTPKKIFDFLGNPISLGAEDGI
jgi:hypothetical protein